MRQKRTLRWSSKWTMDIIDAPRYKPVPTAPHQLLSSGPLYKECESRSRSRGAASWEPRRACASRVRRAYAVYVYLFSLMIYHNKRITIIRNKFELSSYRVPSRRDHRPSPFKFIFVRSILSPRAPDGTLPSPRYVKTYSKHF